MSASHEIEAYQACLHEGAESYARNTGWLYAGESVEEFYRTLEEAAQSTGGYVFADTPERPRGYARRLLRRRGRV